MSGKAKARLYAVVLDEATLPRLATDQDHERAVAIFDLVEENAFAVRGRDDGPYSLTIAQLEAKLNFLVRTEAGALAAEFSVSMTPFRRIVKDYFEVCDSYYRAIRTASPSQIEAIDMGRRGLNNEGSEVLRERLKGKVEIDHNTARRLFTLICALHFRA